MNEATISLIASLVALAVGIVLIVLYKRKVVDGELIEGTANLMQGIEFPQGSAFGMILEYAKTAVLTVEQLVKTGVIGKDDETRKNAAMNIVEQAAKVDGLPYGAAEMEVASACIEAEVAELPRNQKTE